MNAANQTTASSPAEMESPLPLEQFKRFLIVFHAVFAGGLVFLLWMRWSRPHFEWSWRDTVLLVLVVTQLALYTRFFVYPTPRTMRWRWFLSYFAASYAIWFAEWQIEPGLEWVVWAYMGQMFGSLPPRVTVPASLAVFAVYFSTKLGWAGIASLRTTELMGHGAVVIGITSVGLFLYRLVVTSIERARLIEQLKKAQQELQASRDREAELARLRERERLARDLHDSLGHGLVTLSVQLEAIQRLIPSDPARASAMLTQMKELTRSSMEQLRRSLAGMRAPGLGDRALLPALANLCDETRERTGATIACEVPESAPALPREVEEALWGAAQEAIRNAERHANARQIGLSVSVQADRATLQVTDDGIGIPPDAETRDGHFGLRGLRERVEGVGGTMRISRQQPSGTCIQAEIPLIALTR